MVLVVEIVQHALMIAAFVTVMMLIVEYINVQTQGALLRALSRSRGSQYLVAALLGAIPGCLGAFAVVALYAHRRVTIGALVATMIATSGDEAFVMLALFPGTAALVTVGLVAVGIAAGYLADRCLPALTVSAAECRFLDTHARADCRCFDPGEMLANWRPPSLQRAALTFGLLLMLVAVTIGLVGPDAWGWKRITFLLLVSAGIFVAATVPDHFLEQHLWHHVVRRHVPRIALWTFAALAVMALLTRAFDLGAVATSNPWLLLAAAAVVGLLPESGPHLIFVAMYADGMIPLSVLVTSMIVQDGHGMLPLLSASTRAFLVVKLINGVVGFAAGAAMLASGF